MRVLVERLLVGLDDPMLRTLLEAAAIVRQFDEGTLAALVGPDLAEVEFPRQARPSMGPPACERLMPHNDVRRILAEDLRRRHPEHYRDLRLRALVYYRTRISPATGEAREGLVVEQLFLWEDAFVRGVFFVEAEPGEVWLERGRPEDEENLLRIWRFWREQVLGSEIRLTCDRDLDVAFLRTVLRYQGTRVRWPAVETAECWGSTRSSPSAASYCPF